MKDIFTVAKFTAKDMLKRKSFRISTLIIMLLIIVGCNVPAFLSSISNDNGFRDTILISDPSNIYSGTLDQLTDNTFTLPDGTNLQDYYDIIIEAANLDDIKSRVLDGKLTSAIIVNRTDSGINLDYIVKNIALTSHAPSDLLTVLNTIYTNLQISQLDLTPAQLTALTTPLEITMTQVDDQQIHGNIFAMMLLSIVLFYAIYFCAFQVSSSITTEKTSKIIETLVTSTSPRNIVIGKTIGIGLVGLFQMILIVGTAIISAYCFLSPELISSIFDLSQFTPTLAIMSIIYFILGYTLYAFAYALTGSTVNKPEDIQSANAPIAIIAVIGFYLAYFTLTDPTSNINILATLLPISSPFCTPIRLMMGVSSPLEVVLSIIILLLTISIIAHIAIRIYSNAILNYGTKLSLSELLKIYKNK